MKFRMEIPMRNLRMTITNLHHKCKAFFYRMLYLFLLSTLLASCSHQTSAFSSSSELAYSLIQKYNTSDTKYEYASSNLTIHRNEVLHFPIHFNPYEKDFSLSNDVIRFYMDADLTHSIHPYIHWEETTMQLTITPPENNKLEISTNLLKKEFLDYYPNMNSILFYQEIDWGNLGKFYMVQYIDLETGQKLDKPLMTVLTIQGELDTPKINFFDTKDGMASFTWKPISNAEKYLIIETNSNHETGSFGPCYVIGETAKTKWVSSDIDCFAGETKFTNTNFRIYKISEDDWLDTNTANIYENTYRPEDGSVLLEENITKYYGVIAISKDGTSMVSNLYSEKELSSYLPYKEASHAGQSADTPVDSIGELPTHSWVVLCDGRLKQNLIHYDTKKAEIMYMNINAKKKNSPAISIANVCIPYTIDGTSFSGTASVILDSTDTLKQDLQLLTERQDALKSKTGSVTLDFETDTSVSADHSTASPIVDDISHLTKDDMPITANDALSEYLAIHMLSGFTRIDLTSFPESANSDYVFDAWKEAFYQNPLILGVRSAVLSKNGKVLTIVYENAFVNTKQKQEEIKQKIPQIISEIMEPDMTELEQEFAINQYLCENIQYDYSALENAEKYDFTKTDPEFQDSFTAYGALIQKKGVCASYASAFKLLADAAGLRCVVVTGTLEGSIPHTWNKVQIDHQWYVVDPTNNATEYIPNVLLNLSDQAAKRALLENKEYALNSSIEQYKSASDDKEYYHLKHSYFSLENIAFSLADELKKEKQALLRTEYTLTEKQYQAIINEVKDLTGIKKIKGLYWLGLIFLSAQ